MSHIPLYLPLIILCRNCYLPLRLPHLTHLTVESLWAEGICLAFAIFLFCIPTLNTEPGTPPGIQILFFQLTLLIVKCPQVSGSGERMGFSGRWT